MMTYTNNVLKHLFAAKLIYLCNAGDLPGFKCYTLAANFAGMTPFVITDRKKRLTFLKQIGNVAFDVTEFANSKNKHSNIYKILKLGDTSFGDGIIVWCLDRTTRSVARELLQKTNHYCSIS